MIKSMTAFSQCSNVFETITVDVAIRSYNSRHLDIALYCPEDCRVFEENIKKIVAMHHDRGRIEIRLTIQDDEKSQDQFAVDEAKAQSYYNALTGIKNQLNVSSEISLSDIISVRDIIVPVKKEQDSDKIWSAIEPAILSACLDFDKMRRLEGENLYSDLSTRIDYIEKNLKKIEKDAKQMPHIYKKKLMNRIACLASENENMDPVRISQEAAILADRSDISEEIVRLYSHIKQFREILDDQTSGGRKLNFLIQEFNRELNTIGSKAGQASLSHKVVDLKSALEKIREQVQNIE